MFGAMGGLLGRPFTVLPHPYNAPKLNVACFGSMGVGIWGRIPVLPPPHLG